MKVLLVCNAGMSTSMLVQKMEASAKEQGIDLTITAMPITAAYKEVNDWDVVMLGPQVRHELKKLQAASNGTPVEVIDMRAYGMMDGKKVLEAAKAAINK